ncbi:uncharacterized protein HD556DRAFT_774503 [Suillus plorans]|uniref:DUF6535 domain-containing protein n=1 Tax=Suillus plorans TaxID=116603 RepID=A0A9P7AHC9_9AGAM|nr:uncharacterized protein HD556DRAFT_774503 [Suillus plorans]KAG1789502.1 hypothetical protein HD556DRAFT_774503 [Suillus plorans]
MVHMSQYALSLVCCYGKATKTRSQFHESIFSRALSDFSPRLLLLLPFAAHATPLCCSATYKKVSTEHDDDFLDRANDDMGIIAGLFSVVNSTFIVRMQPDPGDTTNALVPSTTSLSFSFSSFSPSLLLLSSIVRIRLSHVSSCRRVLGVCA